MKAGISRLQITPPIGGVISGGHKPVISTGILDDLYATAIAFGDGERTVVAITLDILELAKRDTDAIRALVSEKTGLDADAVLVHSIHTHTGPEVSGIMHTPDPAYVKYLFNRIADAVKFAMDDMTDARFFIGRGEAPGATFIRRFKMKDGTVKTNAPWGDPDVIGTQGTPDNTVQLLKIVRENKADIALVNFQVHPASLGGTKISADFVHFVRLTLEQALADEAGGKGAIVAYFNGAQGDSNHIGYSKHPGSRYDHMLRHVGRLISAAVLTCYTYAEELTCEKIAYKQIDAEVPEYQGYPKTMLHITCLAIGEIAFIGFPGEPYAEIGRRVKAGAPYSIVIPSCNTNGWVSYIPTREAIPFGGLGVDTDANPDIEDICVNSAIELAKELKELV